MALRLLTRRAAASLRGMTARTDVAVKAAPDELAALRTKASGPWAEMSIEEKRKRASPRGRWGAGVPRGPTRRQRLPNPAGHTMGHFPARQRVWGV